MAWNYKASSVSLSLYNPKQEEDPAKSSSSRAAEGRKSSRESSSKSRSIDVATSVKSSSSSSSRISSSSGSSSLSAIPGDSGSHSKSRSSSEKTKTKETVPDPWEKAHPSAALSTDPNDRPRVWPFPIGYDKARDPGSKRLYWESGVPHVVGHIKTSEKPQATINAEASVSSIGPPPDGTRGSNLGPEMKPTSDSKVPLPRAATPAASAAFTPIDLSKSGQPIDATKSIIDKARSPKAVQDTAKLEEIKKLYMQLKQDPTTDPEKLKKVKAFLLATKASSQPEISKAGQGDPPSSSKDKAKGILKDVLKGVQDTTSRSAKSDLKNPTVRSL